MNEEKIRLGDLLIEQNLLTGEQLKLALEDQKEDYDKLGNILVKLGFITDNNLMVVLSKQFNIEYIDIFGIDVDYINLNNKNLNLYENLSTIPFKEDNENIHISISDPLDYESLEKIKDDNLYKEIKFYISKEKDIKQIYERLNIQKETKLIVKQLKSEIKNDFANVEENENSSIMNLINQIISNAILNRSSDIHIEPTEYDMIIRVRIDGMLKEIYTFNLEIFNLLLSKIKILSELDIAEKLEPQDGRFSLVIKSSRYDFRVSTLPSFYGESIVIRILDSEKVLLDVSELGIEGSNLNKFMRLIKKPNGIVLVTGPTGSGKTTTLYGALNEIKDINTKIITIEDPIEYRLPLITQTQINEKRNTTYSSILKAILRQDPDKIMIGEIRDVETLTAMSNASMTGHLVFSTLHTNSAIGAINRMIHMGLKRYIIADTLAGVTAQRLIRKNCDNCLISYNPNIKLKEEHNSDINENITWYKGKGCKKCNNTGYSGRVMVNEILEIGDEIRDLINNQKSSQEILVVAKKNGFKTMFQDGILKCIKKETTLEEIIRVLG